MRPAAIKLKSTRDLVMLVSAMPAVVALNTLLGLLAPLTSR
jgi:hypothetical protein